MGTEGNEGMCVRGQGVIFFLSPPNKMKKKGVNEKEKKNT
jgi:hypothetical protein